MSCRFLNLIAVYAIRRGVFLFLAFWEPGANLIIQTSIMIHGSYWPVSGRAGAVLTPPAPALM
jgi:hypothetical protein